MQVEDEPNVWFYGDSVEAFCVPCVHLPASCVVAGVMAVDVNEAETLPVE